jgi:hypothetical protein
MAYDYNRSKAARVPGEFPDTDFDKFTKNLNYALVAAIAIQKDLERRFPNKAKAVGRIRQEMLELREDMLWVATSKGDVVRTRR